jgi:hypothetical protein
MLIFVSFGTVMSLIIYLTVTDISEHIALDILLQELIAYV